MIKLTLSVEEILNPTDVLSKYSDVFDYWKEVKDKPARTPNVVLWLRRIIKCLIELHFCSYKHVFQRLISFIVYDRRSFSGGWFFIILQFAIYAFLRSCTVGWYVVTKGNSLSLLFCSCSSADCLWSKLTSDNDLSIFCLGYPRFEALIRFIKHPRRPRGSQSSREKRRDESFQVRAKEPLGTDSYRTISKNSSG